MSRFARFFNLKNPLRLDEERILAEQLRLLLNNYSITAPAVVLVVLLILWALADDSNALAIQLWCAAAILVALQSYFHSRHYLRAGIAHDQVRRLVWKVMAMRVIDGLLWAHSPGSRWIPPTIRRIS